MHIHAINKQFFNFHFISNAIIIFFYFIIIFIIKNINKIFNIKYYQYIISIIINDDNEYK